MAVYTNDPNCQVMHDEDKDWRGLKGQIHFCKPNFKSCEVIVLYDRKCHLIACLKKLGLEISFSWSYTPKTD